MDVIQETEDYIKEMIDHSLGLDVSNHTLELKLRASEEVQKCLRGECLDLQIRLKAKDELIDRARAEASLNAQAMKKFVEENQKLAMECTSLLDQRERLERECKLYEKDREVLMEFGNEADERARKAELRVFELEEELSRVTREAQSYNYQQEASKVATSEELMMEQNLLDSLLTTLVGDDKVIPHGHAFIKENGGLESFEKLLTLWNSLRPSTQKVLALAAHLKTLEIDKEHLRTNLTTAEEEVNLLFKENKILDKENKRLLRQQRERCYSTSGEKITSSDSAKGSKRKFSPIEGKIDFNESDSPRKPLSSLQQNSPEARKHKK